MSDERPVMRIGLLGFGTVGTGVVRHLRHNGALMADRIGVRLELARVADLDITRDRGVQLEPGLLTTDAAAVVRDPGVDVVVELIGGTAAARQLTLAAFQAGKPVVTANKALICQHGEELFGAAAANSVDYYYEASVAGGIPLIKAQREGLVANRIESIHAILNGTCNYILTRMTEDGLPFDDALARAQALGYAEADPTLDIDGHDTMHKAVILASLAYGFWVDHRRVYTEGIRRLAACDIAFARRLGYEVKLLAVIRSRPEGGAVEVRVHPALLPAAHILASVRGVFNAAFVKGDVVGETLYYGRGAGMDATASAVLADLADVALNRVSGSHRRVADFTPHGMYGLLLPIDDVETRYYLRIMAEDRAGVLAQITAIFGEHGISIASMVQQEGPLEGADGVPLIFLTHRAREAAIREATARIEALATTRGPVVSLRVEATGKAS